MKLIDHVLTENAWRPTGMTTASFVLTSPKEEQDHDENDLAKTKGVHLQAPLPDEDMFAYMTRMRGQQQEDKGDEDTSSSLLLDMTLYRQIIGAANAFKEGDVTIGVAAADETSRLYARQLLGNTTLRALHDHAVHQDDLYHWIVATTLPMPSWLARLTMNQFKTLLLEEQAERIHEEIMPCLTSDMIACVVKLMSNDELIHMGQTIFNPLPGSNIGAAGYMSARIQPNSPTDNTQDILWQVLDGFSYAVGDVVLGTNPVSSEPASVAKIATALSDVICTFGLQDTLPHCVLAHIDVQAEAETQYCNNKESSTVSTTGIWFQSLAGTVRANKTFDVTMEKMQHHLATQRRHGKRYGLYGETGQGADFTNGHAAGFDMVVHEARKYGFLRALKQGCLDPQQWVHANDVAGFIGPEVFKTKEQLVRCCLEDTVMGKLHGLTIGLDICSTLHMDVTLDDLDWCIDHVMPANPAYLMALPTKNDPMLSYLTTSFSDHVRVREKFGYKINDAMWRFYQRLGVIDEQGKPTEHFGQPLWVYYQYRLAKGDERSRDEIYAEGRDMINQVQDRGVPIAEGYGENIWDPPPVLHQKIRHLYQDAKISLWTEWDHQEVQAVIPRAMPLRTQAKDRKDYVYHPESGEALSAASVQDLQDLRASWQEQGVPQVQFVISDGLNVRALTDDGHLLPFLTELGRLLEDEGFQLSSQNLVITYGRVRAGYMVGEVLFGGDKQDTQPRGIVHIIGERPGSGHHNFSAYLTAQPAAVWGTPGAVDHDVTRVVSGISDTAFHPHAAAAETAMIFQKLWAQHM